MYYDYGSKIKLVFLCVRNVHYEVQILQVLKYFSSVNLAKRRIASDFPRPALKRRLQIVIVTNCMERRFRLRHRQSGHPSICALCIHL